MLTNLNLSIFKYNLRANLAFDAAAVPAGRDMLDTRAR
jgi:hypothetical protein